VVELRCDGCEPLSLGSVWRIDNPVLRPHLTAVRRPSAVVSRMAAWSHAWWPAAIESGRVPCTRCGSRVEITAYERTDVAEPRVRRGWLAACGACGEALSTSLLGLTLCLPEVRGLRARRPRAHAVPTRTAERAGRPVLVVGLADDSSGDRVEVLFDDATTRPVAVVASR
jgi:hypothetical protein